jgi:hypothetical protein
MLMRNYPLNTKDSEYDPLQKNSSRSHKTVQHGGGEGDEDMPNGGFPPIFVCTKATVEKKEENKNREFSSKKTSLSIKDIMQKRRDATPFVPN